MVAGVWFAFGLNMLLRDVGIVPLLVRRGGPADPAAWFLLAGGVGRAGASTCWSAQPGGGNQYFTRTGFAFGVMLSAWGYGLVFDRA